MLPAPAGQVSVIVQPQNKTPQNVDRAQEPPMTDAQALLSTIAAPPDADLPRLIYADWLEEHGQLDRARLIRVQIELARLPDNEGEPTALQVEEEQLLAACE